MMLCSVERYWCVSADTRATTCCSASTSCSACLTSLSSRSPASWSPARSSANCSHQYIQENRCLVSLNQHCWNWIMVCCPVGLTLFTENNSHSPQGYNKEYWRLWSLPHGFDQISPHGLPEQRGAFSHSMQQSSLPLIGPNQTTTVTLTYTLPKRLVPKVFIRVINIQYCTAT